MENLRKQNTMQHIEGVNTRKESLLCDKFSFYSVEI